MVLSRAKITELLLILFEASWIMPIPFFIASPFSLFLSSFFFFQLLHYYFHLLFFHTFLFVLGSLISFSVLAFILPHILSLLYFSSSLFRPSHFLRFLFIFLFFTYAKFCAYPLMNLQSEEVTSFGLNWSQVILSAIRHFNDHEFKQSTAISH
jgi:hypothetical protein